MFRKHALEIIRNHGARPPVEFHVGGNRLGIEIGAQKCGIRQRKSADTHTQRNTRQLPCPAHDPHRSAITPALLLFRDFDRYVKRQILPFLRIRRRIRQQRIGVPALHGRIVRIFQIHETDHAKRKIRGGNHTVLPFQVAENQMHIPEILPRRQNQLKRFGLIRRGGDSNPFPRLNALRNSIYRNFEIRRLFPEDETAVPEQDRSTRVSPRNLFLPHFAEIKVIQVNLHSAAQPQSDGNARGTDGRIELQVHFLPFSRSRISLRELVADHLFLFVPISDAPGNSHLALARSDKIIDRETIFRPASERQHIQVDLVGRFLEIRGAQQGIFSRFRFEHAPLRKQFAVLLLVNLSMKFRDNIIIRHRRRLKRTVHQQIAVRSDRQSRIQ